MHIALVHGYFLSDSGSAIYVRELAREFTKQGHDVTLVCQEQSPQSYDFVDSLHDLDERNTKLDTVFNRDTAYSGSCRLVRPHLSGRLLTYVAGPFPGFDAVPFQDAEDSWITEYLDANIHALRTIFSRWPQDLVQANHVVMQPYIAGEAIDNGTPYVVTIHGSALNFTVKEDPRMVPYAKKGLEGATAVVALSATSCQETTGFADQVEVDIRDKTRVLPPGVDMETFFSTEDRSDILAGISTAINPELDDILIFVGRLLWTKGLHYAVAALPIMLKRRPRLHLLVAGDGPMRSSLNELIVHLETGDLEAGERLLEEAAEMRASADFGRVLPDMVDEVRESYIATAANNLLHRIHFMGHIEHARLAPLYAVADLALTPSVFPEAFGLVSIEAIASGALPVATYQTGLRDPLDAAYGELHDPLLKSLVPGRGLTIALADTATELLDAYPTKRNEFRNRLRGLAARDFSWRTLAKRYQEYGRR